jgi:cell shape-determining protein MreC
LTIKEQLRTYKSDTSESESPGTVVSNIFTKYHSNDEESNAIDELLAQRDDLLRENHNLRQENEELTELLKEYEKGLSNATELIRDNAVLSSSLNPD